MTQLSARQHSVLYAVVSEYIGTGEPVGSRKLSAHYGLDLSAASIRSVLKDLEDEGLLEQPHKSAGRTPTRAAYEIYISALMKVRQFPKSEEERIRELVESEVQRPDWLRKTGRLLSELSGAPSVVLQARSETRAVRKVRFIPTGTAELLSVVVLDDGSVENRYIHVESPMEAARLERVHLLLDEMAQGRTLRELREHLQELAEGERNEIGALSRLSEGLLSDALHDVDRRGEVIIEGQSSLLQAASDPGRVRRLMVALEDREQLVNLLGRTLASARVQVFLGEEGELSTESPLSVVAAAYQGPSETPAGALGVLGPTRMNYPELVPLVGAMARAMSGALGDSEQISEGKGDPVAASGSLPLTGHSGAVKPQP